MAELQHSQIKSKLNEDIVPLLDLKDIQNHGTEQKEMQSLSRAVGVAAISIISDADLNIASKAVVDGQGDNGIDLIHYDAQTKTLYLCQSKWCNSHSASFESASSLKFLKGVQDLVSLKKDRFNKKIQDMWPVIDDALARLSSVRLVIAYSGSGRVSDEVQSQIDDFLQDQNDTSELFFYDVITQRELFAYFVNQATAPQIDLTMKLAHYGLVEAPLKAVYGQISAVDIHSWYKNHGNQLFAKNIRNFLGLKSDVNQGIHKTAAESPLNLWYFDNGITIIVDKYTKQVFGGNDRSVGLFDCKNVTIVNGAQTVGTIGRSQLNEESAAILMIRIIAVEDTESEIGKDITRASNTQNRIDARNFVAFDPEQERIRLELLIENIEYEYREGESTSTNKENFDFIEAITTLACASTEISYVATAKSYISGLYLDINSAPYKALFNTATNSRRLWNLIQLVRRIDAIIRSYHDTSSPIHRGVVVHGNRLLPHLIIREIKKYQDISTFSMIDDALITNSTHNIFDKVVNIIGQSYSDAYLQPLFKNASKCLDVRSRVEV